MKKFQKVQFEESEKVPQNPSTKFENHNQILFQKNQTPQNFATNKKFYRKNPRINFPV
jgi:hypothetical protein